MAKRLFDFGVATALLILTLPLTIFAGVGIKLTSRGPIFHASMRMGRGGVPFRMLKFRTMRVAEGNVPSITAPNDARIFPFGALLRNTKIDELPQLLNVLNGTMSLVGPRPEAIQIVRCHYNAWMQETLSVAPGLVSPGATLVFTHGHLLLDKEDPEGSYVANLLAPKLALDRAYMEQADFRGDVQLIARTIVIIARKLLGQKDFPLPKEAGTALRWHDFSFPGLNR